MEDHGTGPARPRRPEPSWPTVIATTVRLWVERHDAVRRRTARAWRVIAIAAVAALVVVATEAVIHRGPAPAAARSVSSGTKTSAPLLAATATRDQAAAWIAGQVAADAIVACDPAMCAALAAAGLPAGRLVVLGTSAADPLGSDVIAATAAVRSQFGVRLESVYAPLIIASFGSGAGRIDIRAVAADGSAAYEASLAADVRARIAAGRQLAGNRRVSVSAAARAALDAGRVDPRLLLALATLAHSQSLRIVAFGDPSPGASPAVPLRSAEIIVIGRGDGTGARLRSMLSFLEAQRPPFLPAHAGIDGGSVLTVEYAAPSPLGLLSGP
jgi:hypothetical protein